MPRRGGAGLAIAAAGAVAENDYGQGEHMKDRQTKRVREVKKEKESGRKNILRALRAARGLEREEIADGKMGTGPPEKVKHFRLDRLHEWRCVFLAALC